VVAREEGQREQVQLPDLRRPVDRRPDGEIDDALADRRELARLVAVDQRHVRVQLHVDPALRALAHEVDPNLCTLAPGEGGSDDGRHPVLGAVVLRVRAGDDERSGQDGRTGCAGFEQETSIHRELLRFRNRSAEPGVSARTGGRATKARGRHSKPAQPAFQPSAGGFPSSAGRYCTESTPSMRSIAAIASRETGLSTSTIVYAMSPRDLFSMLLMFRSACAIAVEIWPSMFGTFA